LLLVGLAPVAGMAQPVEIRADQPSVRLDDGLLYWASLGPVPGPAIDAYRSGKFQPEKTTATHGFGHAPEMWFAVEIRNDSFDDGRAGDPFVVVYDALIVMGYRLFLVREDGLTENLVDYTAFQPFDPEDWAVNRLRSPAFTLAPGETATLLAHLQLAPQGIASVSLTRPDTLARDSLRWASSMVAFYAFALSFIVLGLGFLVAMRSLYGSLYAVLQLAMLLQFGFLDMLFFRFVFPESPQLHLWASEANPFWPAIVLSGMLGFGFRMGPPEQHRYFYVFMALAGVAVLGLGLTVVVPNVPWSLIAIVVVVLALTPSFLLPLSVYQREDNPGNGLRGLLGATALVVAGIVAWAYLGWPIGGLSVRLPFKIVYAVLLTLILAFLIFNLIALRRRHLTAVEARIAALEQEAEQSRKLLETERAYIRARETASAHQRQLATASHDIKQPLMSLRTTFDAIASDMDQELRSRLSESFGYLETLSKSYVDTTVPDDEIADLDAPDATDAAEPDPAEAETYSLSVPLNTVHQMFHGEAVSKGIALRVVDSSVETQALPIVLMRILTNLVSNAVKYTETGRVLIGLRRAGPEIWVCDTGRGMSAAELETFQGAYQKGATSTGHGLGLSFCFELAAANDIGLSVASVEGQGTVFRVSLGQHQPDAARKG
jgi:signal transduction histidine kinase